MDLDTLMQDFEDALLQDSGYSSTTKNTASTAATSVQDEDGLIFNWSPALNWDALYSEQDGFQDLIEALMDDQEESQVMPAAVHACEVPSNSTSPHDDSIIAIEDDTNETEDLKGLRLVHLLMAAAEAISGGNKTHDLAQVILLRLKELASPQHDSNMERLASYFTDALQNLLEVSTIMHGKRAIGNARPRNYNNDIHQNDMLAAFQLLHDMTPYVKFGHFTANQAIIEAVAHHKKIHIVDFDIMEGVQWASLMQALVSRDNGPPVQHLRITALSRSGTCRKFIGTVQDVGRRLMEFAASINLSFSFHQCRLDTDEKFRPSALKLIKGEVLVANCMLHLPHYSHQVYHSVVSYLTGVKTLSPRLVTLVEEEVRFTEAIGFSGRFTGLLHHYSAFCDSLEMGFPTLTRAQALVEKVFIRPRIVRALSRAYEDIGCPWWEWLAAEGFNEVNISSSNHSQARLLLGIFNDGFKVEQLANNRLVLEWNSRPLVSASFWSCSSFFDL